MITRYAVRPVDGCSTLGDAITSPLEQQLGIVKHRMRMVVPSKCGECTGQPTLSREALLHVTSPGRIDGMSAVSLSSLRHMVFFARNFAQADLITLARLSLSRSIVSWLACKATSGYRAKEYVRLR